MTLFIAKEFRSYVGFGGDFCVLVFWTVGIMSVYDCMLYTSCIAFERVSEEDEDRARGDSKYLPCDPVVLAQQTSTKNRFQLNVPAKARLEIKINEHPQNTS